MSDPQKDYTDSCTHICPQCKGDIDFEVENNPDGPPYICSSIDFCACGYLPTSEELLDTYQEKVSDDLLERALMREEDRDVELD